MQSALRGGAKANLRTSFRSISTGPITANSKSTSDTTFPLVPKHVYLAEIAVVSTFGVLGRAAQKRSGGPLSSSS